MTECEEIGSIKLLVPLGVLWGSLGGILGPSPTTLIKLLEINQRLFISVILKGRDFCKETENMAERGDVPPVCRVGHNSTFTVNITVNLVISLPKNTV
jgi:hypothetical protein